MTYVVHTSCSCSCS